MTKVLTLYSSARPDGNTSSLVKTFNELIPGEQCYLDDLHIKQYDYQYRNQNDDFVALIDKMLEVDVIVLASPVYWYSLTPALRRFIDRLTDLTELPNLKPKGKKLREKAFYLFATSVHEEPPASFTSQVVKTLQYFSWKFCGTVHINCQSGFDQELALSRLQPIARKLNTKIDVNSRSLAKDKITTDGLYARYL